MARPLALGANHAQAYPAQAKRTHAYTDSAEAPTNPRYRRITATRDRAICVAIWFALWIVLPDPWKMFAFWIAVAMGAAMRWNAEQWLVARRQANVMPSDIEDA